MLKYKTYLFIYKYGDGKLLKNKICANIFRDKALIKKSDSSLIIFNKLLPDIILDTKRSIAIILNVKAAEFILSIGKLFQKSVNKFKEIETIKAIMDSDSIDVFSQKVMGKNTYLRKLQKIVTSNTYQHFYENLEIINEVIDKFSLNVIFNEKTKQLVVDADTDIVDVLHLLADDYVAKYISKCDDVID